jgi:hypothetical protein
MVKNLQSSSEIKPHPPTLKLLLKVRQRTDCRRRMLRRSVAVLLPVSVPYSQPLHNINLSAPVLQSDRQVLKPSPRRRCRG